MCRPATAHGIRDWNTPGCTRKSTPHRHRQTTAGPRSCRNTGADTNPALTTDLFDVHLGEDPIARDGKRNMIAGFARLLATIHK